MGVLARSTVLGLAAGGRSSVALLVPALARRAPAPVRAVATLSFVGELVTDKLPGVPSRLSAPQLVGRLVAGGTGAAALAGVDGRRGGAVLVAGAVGVLAAFAGSVLGASWRQWAAGAKVPDVAAALGEDAVVLCAVRALTR